MDWVCPRLGQLWCSCDCSPCPRAPCGSVAASVASRGTAGASGIGAWRSVGLNPPWRPCPPSPSPIPGQAGGVGAGGGRHGPAFVSRLIAQVRGVAAVWAPSWTRHVNP